jgi:hypothetical protein
MGRRFCDCGAALSETVFSTTTEPKLLPKLNQDDPDIRPCCTRCGEMEKCPLCFGFGVRKPYINKNGKTVGSESCGYKSDKPLCRCCQKFIRMEFTIGGERKGNIQEGLSQ